MITAKEARKLREENSAVRDKALEYLEHIGSCIEEICKRGCNCSDNTLIIDIAPEIQHICLYELERNGYKVTEYKGSLFADNSNYFNITW